MISIQKDKDLKAFNTFGVSCIASEYVEIHSERELRESIHGNMDLYVLGGGSNLLLPETLNQRILHNRIGGIEIFETDDHVIVEAGGGVNWHDLVTWAIENGLGGIENLALIPGTVGAAPIQNIGAYGVELREVFVSLDAIDLKDGSKRIFERHECRFGYRDSVFKNELKGKFFISKVRLALVREKDHEVNTDYRSLANHLQRSGINDPDIKDVYTAVVDIRRSKLPDPLVIGNSGSFFKNSVVDRKKFEQLLQEHEDLVYYENPDGSYKIPTGWLIEKCGWKGKYIGQVGSYEKQALVLVNKGGGTASEVRELAGRIIRDVKEKFGITIIPEVNVL